jgi:predicted enzyme related to lactoylglutathione lyase
MAGKLVHFEIPAKDTARSKEFYGSLFGWQFQNYGEMDYHMTQVDDQQGGAVSGMQEGSNPTIYFDVDDIDTATAKVRELGGEADEKQPVPGMGWFAACKDTEGTNFSLWQSDESAPVPESAPGG